MASGRELRAIWQRLCLNARVDGDRHARFQTGLHGQLSAPSCCVESRQPEARGKQGDREEASVVAISSGERCWWLDPVRAAVVGGSGHVLKYVKAELVGLSLSLDVGDEGRGGTLGDSG